jgi:hypothetical protein
MELVYHILIGQQYSSNFTATELLGKCKRLHQSWTENNASSVKISFTRINPDGVIYSAERALCLCTIPPELILHFPS